MMCQGGHFVGGHFQPKRTTFDMVLITELSFSMAFVSLVDTVLSHTDIGSTKQKKVIDIPHENTMDNPKHHEHLYGKSCKECFVPHNDPLKIPSSFESSP
jgi:hypothetical protein